MQQCVPGNHAQRLRHASPNDATLLPLLMLPLLSIGPGTVLSACFCTWLSYCVCCRNEENKAYKAKAKEEEADRDKKNMEEYATQLEKQERARQAQLERMKVKQAQQEQDAKSRPEAKKWIDPAIIDRYTAGEVVRLDGYMFSTSLRV